MNNEQFIKSLVESNIEHFSKIDNKDDFKIWLTALLRTAVNFGKTCK